MASVSPLTVTVRVRGVWRALWTLRGAAALARGRTTVRRWLPELLVAGALVGAWAGAVTGARVLVAAYLPRALPAVWPLALAVLLLSLAGWRFAYTVARDGLYVLTGADARDALRGGPDA